MNSRSTIKTAALAVLAVVISSAAPAQATELRLATQPAPLYAPIFVAKQKHWIEDELKKDGVTVKWSSFVAGPPENESFAAGQQDVGVMGDTPALIARAAGQNTRIVGISAVGPKALALAVPKDSTLKTAAELKGKRVAVTKGSYAHHLLYVILKNAGLQFSDIKLVHLPPADLVSVDGREMSRPDLVIAGMISIGLIGKLMDVVLRRLERRLLPWREGDT
jgi:sulfonate transport system substrate-binding protein